MAKATLCHLVQTTQCLLLVASLFPLTVAVHRLQSRLLQEAETSTHTFRTMTAALLDGLIPATITVDAEKAPIAMPMPRHRRLVEATAMIVVRLVTIVARRREVDTEMPMRRHREEGTMGRGAQEVAVLSASRRDARGCRIENAKCIADDSANVRDLQKIRLRASLRE